MGALLWFLCSGASAALPLVALDYTVDVAGPVADVWVEQVFRNDGERSLEATYAFPLHEQAAVDRLQIRVGERIIDGRIDERAAARETFEEAAAAGQLAALTEQERPNLFTQTVANIAPGEEVRVALHLVQPVPRTDGLYELVLPLVVAPRFVPAGEPLTLFGEEPATLWRTPRTSVPDHVRVSPPVVTGDTGVRVDIDVTVEAGLRIAALELRSHEGDVHLDDSFGHVQVHDVAPDRDFVLQWRLHAATADAALLVQGKHALLTFEPPAQPTREEHVPREIIWVLDTSCSMRGHPLELAKRAMLAAIDGMDERDSFGLLAFSSGVRALAQQALPATGSNKARARAAVRGLSAGGGTYLLDGVAEALDLPGDPERQRFVVFITDGLIGNEHSVLAHVAEQAVDAHIFAFGIGRSPNRYLLDELSRVGRGRTTWVRQEDTPAEAVDRFLATIEAPMLTELTVDWRDWEVDQVTPERLGGLFAGQPVFVTAAVRAEGDQALGVSARSGRGAFSLDVWPTRLEGDGRALEVTWARQRIAALEREALTQGSRREQILSLSLKHQVLSTYTAFVAVEQGTRRPVRPTDGVEMPQMLPSGMAPSNATHLLIASGVEEITVAAHRQTVDVEQTHTGSVLTREFLQRIPTGRSYQSAVSMAAGAIANTNPNLAGSAGNENTWLLDGANITDPVSGTLSANFSYDAIEQVEVLLGAWGPEWGGLGIGATGVATRQRVVPNRVLNGLSRDPRDPRQRWRQP